MVGGCAEGPLLDDVRAEGFRVIAVPFVRRVSPLAHMRAFRALVAIIRAEQPDIVHAHMPISGFLTRLAAWRAGVPVIAYTCHGFLFNHRGLVHCRAGVLSFLMEWLAARVTDVFLTVSEAEAERCPAAGHLPTRGGRRQRPGSRAVPAQSGGAASIRAALGVPDGPGGDDRRVSAGLAQGLSRTGAAMAAVPDAELWVVGERLASDRGADMVSLLQAAGLCERLRLLGYRADIPELMAAADIFALPSRFEGLPMSVIEAMLTGLPVVATDVRGPDEQVQHEVTGLKVPAGDAVGTRRRAAASGEGPGPAARLGEAGRMRALQCYDEAKVLARTLDLLGL